MRKRRFTVNKLHIGFLKVKYSYRAKFLGIDPQCTCYFLGKRETEADSHLIKASEWIFTEAMVDNKNEAAEVVSEE